MQNATRRAHVLPGADFTWRRHAAACANENNESYNDLPGASAGGIIAFGGQPAPMGVSEAFAVRCRELVGRAARKFSKEGVILPHGTVEQRDIAVCVKRVQG